MCQLGDDTWRDGTLFFKIQQTLNQWLVYSTVPQQPEHTGSGTQWQNRRDPAYKLLVTHLGSVFFSTTKTLVFVGQEVLVSRGGTLPLGKKSESSTKLKATANSWSLWDPHKIYQQQRKRLPYLQKNCNNHREVRLLQQQNGAWKKCVRH